MKTKYDFYKRSFLIVSTFFSIAFVSCISCGFSTNEVYSAIGFYGSALVVVALAIVLFISSKSVGTNQIGAILYFHKPLFQVESGYIFVLPFYELRKIDINPIVFSFPGDEDFPKQITITHGSNNNSSDLINDFITTSVSLTAVVQVIDFISYMETTRNETELKRKFRAGLINLVAVQLAKNPLSYNLRNREKINRDLKINMQKFTANWGITIIGIQVEEMDYGNEINSAQKKLKVSQINIPINENDSQKIVFDGVARGKALEAIHYYRGKGLKKLCKELDIIDTVAVYQMDRLSEALSKGPTDLNLIGSDLKPLLNFFMANYGSHKGSNSPKELN